MQSTLSRLHAGSASVLAWITPGLRWWWDELSAMLTPLVLRFGYQAAPTFLVAGPTGEPALREPREKPPLRPDTNQSDGRNAWAAQCAGQTIHISLDASLVMRLPISLPRSALPELRNATRFQLINESPIPVEEILFDVRIPHPSAVQTKPGSVVVDVALCRRSTIEALSHKLEAAGLSASIGYSSNGAPPLAFVFHRSRGAKNAHAALRTNRRLALCAILICLGTLPATYLGARWLTAQTLGEVQTLRSEHDALLLRYERQAATRSAQSALANHMGAVRLSNVLDDMARLLPNTVWLNRIQYDNGTLAVQAYASDPTAAARALEASRLITGVALDTVTGSGAAVGTPVQFTLSATVQMRASP